MHLLTFGQGEDNQWYFGEGAALDFNSGNPIAKLSSVMNISEDQVEGSASIADCKGQLLFYSNGEQVWNRNNQLMLNGSGLNGDKYSTQSALIVKKPNSSNTYYLFTASDEHGLQYSTVNMLLNGGKGDVIAKNTALNPTGTQKLTLTRHANGQDVWVITHYNNSARFDAFLINSSGVSISPVTSLSGPMHNSGHGDIKISPDGSKILTCVQRMDLVCLSSFNTANGSVSNTSATLKFPQPHGGEFSANSQVAYLNALCFSGFSCTNAGISQLNLLAGSTSLIWSTSKVISNKTFLEGSMRRHSNGIIYCTGDDMQSLSAIKNPNTLGLGCNFTNNAVSLGGRTTSWELPNNVLLSPPIVPGSIDFTATAGICPQDPYNFNIVSTQNITAVSWNFGDPGSGGNTFSSLLTPTHTFSAPGTFTISVFLTIDGCYNTSLTKTITVIANPKAVAGPDLNICSGSAASIGAAAGAPYSYFWSPSIGLSNANIANPKITKTNAGPANTVSTYTLTTSYQTCMSLDTVEVTIKALPTVDAGNNSSLCSGDSISIGAAANNAILTYTWSPTVGLSSSSISNPKLSLSNNSTAVYKYVVSVQGKNACTNKDSILITLHPLPNAGKRSNYLCPGGNLQLTAVNNGTSYAWTPNQNISDTTIYNPTVWPLNPQFYFLKVTDVNSCSNFDSVFVNSTGTVPTDAGADSSICKGDSIKIGGNPSAPVGITYQWLPTQGLSNSHIANPMASPSNTTKYYLHTQSDTCVGLDSIVVLVHQLPTVDAGQAAEICFGDSIQLHASGAEKYLWSPNNNIDRTDSAAPKVFPKKTGFFTVSGIDQFSCINRDSVEISVNPLPPANAGLDSGLCIRDSIQLHATGGTQYLWSPALTLSSATIANPFAFPKQNTIYALVVTDSKGCKKADSIAISVHHLPVIQTLSNTLICEGSSIHMYASGGVKYHWWPTESLNDSNSSKPWAQPLTPTTYYVAVTDSYHCTDTASFQISLNIVPKAEFTVIKQTPGCEGYRSEFTNTSINADSQLWIYGDGGSSTEKTPQHTYPFGKNVVTQLIVTNNGLCSDTMSIPLHIKDIADAVNISNGNVLTLNNDGLNECFTVSVKDEFEKCVAVKIYDRWGVLMYKSNTYGECWDGKNSSTQQLVANGTYYYIISINDYSKTGYITIFGAQ